MLWALAVDNGEVGFRFVFASCGAMRVFGQAGVAFYVLVYGLSETREVGNYLVRRGR